MVMFAARISEKGAGAAETRRKRRNATSSDMNEKVAIMK
jgi:hypothetical protein